MATRLAKRPRVQLFDGNYYHSCEDNIVKDCVFDLDKLKKGYVFNKTQLERVLEIRPNASYKTSSTGYIVFRV